MVPESQSWTRSFAMCILPGNISGFTIFLHSQCESICFSRIELSCEGHLTPKCWHPAFLLWNGTHSILWLLCGKLKRSPCQHLQAEAVSRDGLVESYVSLSLCCPSLERRGSQLTGGFRAGEVLARRGAPSKNPGISRWRWNLIYLPWKGEKTCCSSGPGTKYAHTLHRSKRNEEAAKTSACNVHIKAVIVF